MNNIYHHISYFLLYEPSKAKCYAPSLILDSSSCTSVSESTSGPSPRPTTLTKRLRFLRKVHGTLSFGHAFPKFFVFVAESEYLPKALLP